MLRIADVKAMGILQALAAAACRFSIKAWQSRLLHCVSQVANAGSLPSADVPDPRSPEASSGQLKIQQMTAVVTPVELGCDKCQHHAELADAHCMQMRNALTIKELTLFRMLLACCIKFAS